MMKEACPPRTSSTAATARIPSNSNQRSLAARFCLRLYIRVSTRPIAVPPCFVQGYVKKVLHMPLFDVSQCH
jgi:hypothetical protein